MIDRQKKYSAVALFIAFAMITASCSKEQGEVQKLDNRISVGVSVVHRADERLASHYTGSLEGEKQAVLYARLSEAVTKINFSEGDKVQADDVLIEINPDGVGSDFRRAQSVFRNSEKNLKKMEYLFKEGAVSESAYDAALTANEVNQAAFDAASRMVNIHTPIAGIVTSIDVSVGELVNIGQKLAIVATTHKLRVRFGVNSDEVAGFKVGSSIEIKSELVNGAATGKVVSIAKSANPDTRSFQVEAIIDNAEGKFRPGMFANVEFVRQELSQVLSVPQKAIVTLGGVPTVFTVANGHASKREIKTGYDLGGKVIIEDGLNDGDTLIVLGQDYLDDGTPVNITTINGRTL